MSSEKSREAQRRWRERHPEYAAEAVKKWREENPEKVRAQWKRQAERRRLKGPRVRHTSAPCVNCGETDRMPSGSCRPCTVRRNEERKAKFPELVRQQQNERSRRYRASLTKDEKYATYRRGNLAKARKELGLTAEQHAEMVRAQDNRCAICGNPPSGKRFRSLSIDHCHSSGKVRALLCHRCNLVIGQMNDEPKLLQAAINYLNKHKEPPA
jgi:hypothetical protein